MMRVRGAANMFQSGVAVIASGRIGCFDRGGKEGPMTGSSRAAGHNLVEEPGVARTLQATLVAIIASALAVSAFTRYLG